MEKDGIVTIGITPEYPATGYGYVQTDEEITVGQPVESFTVKQFVEKPDLELATGYLKNGGYYWNSGIFVFKVSVFLQSVRKFSPALYTALMRINKVIGTKDYDTLLDKIYSELEPVSIDYGILEKAGNVFLVKGGFVWNDLGSWEEVYKYDKKDENQNSRTGEVVFLETKNSCVYAPESLVAVIGLENVIVVQEGDAILVCNRDRAQDIKRVVNEISKRKLNKYL
jgi:mannose-1-phosphate guanylyltransferase